MYTEVFFIFKKAFIRERFSCLSSDPSRTSVTSSAGEAELFVAGLHVVDDSGHHVPHGLLPCSVESCLLCHDFNDDLSNQLEVINRDLMLGCMAVGQRLEDGSVVAFGLQKFTKFLQHSGTVGRNSCITSQVSLSDADKLREQLLGVWMLREQTSQNQTPMTGVVCFHWTPVLQNQVKVSHDVGRCCLMRKGCNVAKDPV